MNQYSIDWVTAKQICMIARGLTDPEMARSNSAVYLSRTDSSIASEDTVRMAVTASEAIEAALEFRAEMLRSSLVSNRIFSQPEPRRGGRPAKTTTKPNFQL